MDILTEHRDGEITVFTNNSTPEIHLTTRRAEAKEEVAENMGAVTTVADNMEDVKGAAKYAQTFDDVLLNLPAIIKAIPAAETAVQAKDDAIAAKDTAVASASLASVSATGATESAQKAEESEKKALASEQSAQNSANSASASKTAAQNSALAAAESATYAKQDLDSIKADAEMVAEYTPKAIQAAESAEIAKASAISAAERAEQASQGVEGALSGKQDKLTAGEGIKIEGNVISTEGGKLPDNVYTQDNLVAGDNIEIKEVVNPNVIDDNTLLCWHFDEDDKDVINGNSAGVAIQNDYYKFGTGSAVDRFQNSNVTLAQTITDTTDFTADFWIKGVDYGAENANWELRFLGNGVLYLFTFGRQELLQVLNSHYESIGTIAPKDTVSRMEWNHYAWTYRADKRMFTCYINGVSQGTLIIPEAQNFRLTTLDLTDANYAVHRIDELRITKSLAWEKDFTPPTEAYTKGEGGSKKAISAIIPPVELPDDVYRQSNLLGGKDIEIIPEPVEGGIDEHTLACWHFDDSLEDEVKKELFSSKTLNFGYGKFGSSISNTSNNTNNVLQDFDTANPENDFTVDFWINPSIAGTGSLCIVGNGNSTSGSSVIRMRIGFFYQKIWLENYYNDESAFYEYPFKSDTWYHFVFQNKQRKASVYLDGKKVLERDFSGKTLSGKGFKIECYSSRMDELRISNVARYAEDFTPPTQPYRKAEPTGNYMINFTGQSCKNIGEVYYSQSSLASDNAGALPLFTGETIASANTIYPDFYAWVESHTELQCTAEEYETALTTYGECAKYVVSNGSLRLPKLANYVKIANTSEGITQKEAGLPNITGFVMLAGTEAARATGAFTVASEAGSGAGHERGNNHGFNFDASLSSEVYGKSETVTPAHTTLFPWVFAYNASVPASTAQAAEFQEGLSGKADANLGNIPTNYDYVVESYNDGTNWYRVYKSGWLEQGGHRPTGKDGQEDVIFLKPFKDVNYQIFKTNTWFLSTTVTWQWIVFYSKTPTQATTFNSIQTTSGSGYDWYACGQGAEL